MPGRRAAGERAAGRAQATRATLLAAARDVFAAGGFADANITDVVAKAGASVGSLYHHFGGKADLYLALFDDYQASQEHRAAEAVRAARLDGETDTMQLFLVGATAYLRGCWEERELARVFLDGGGPPGFELIARRRYREWVRVNAALLNTEDQPLGETLVVVLTSVVAEAGREVAVQETEDGGDAPRGGVRRAARPGRHRLSHPTGCGSPGPRWTTSSVGRRRGPQVAPRRVRVGVAEADDADDVMVVGYAERSAELRDDLRLHPDEQRAEALVDRLQQHQQRDHAGVDVPERHRPARLVAVGPALVLAGRSGRGRPACTTTSRRSPVRA